jgi:hypothetical protein
MDLPTLYLWGSLNGPVFFNPWMNPPQIHIELFGASDLRQQLVSICEISLLAVFSALAARFFVCVNPERRTVTKSSVTLLRYGTEALLVL